MGWLAQINDCACSYNVGDCKGALSMIAKTKATAAAKAASAAAALV